MAELFLDIAKRSEQRDREFADIEKFNPYHGADGRFTSGSGATSFTYKPGASKAHDNAIANEKAKSNSIGRAKWRSTSPVHPKSDARKYMKQKQPEGDRSISNRKGGEIMDDIGTHKVSTSSTISALKQAGFKRKDIKNIQRQYDLSDAQVKEISDNWSKYN